MKTQIPTFKNEAEERRFWQTHDSSEYVNWSDAEEVLMPKLRPSTRSISLRLPEAMVEELKLLANLPQQNGSAGGLAPPNPDQEVLEISKVGRRLRRSRVARVRLTKTANKRYRYPRIQVYRLPLT